MCLRTRQFLRVLLAFGLSILWSHYVTVETARANNVLFVSDDTYSIVWILDSTTGETLRGFSVPEVAVGNSVPRGRSGLAYANNELYYTHSSSHRVWVLSPVDGTLQRSFSKPGRIDSSSLGASDDSVYVIESGRRDAELFKMDVGTGLSHSPLSVSAGKEGLAFASNRRSHFVDTGAFEVREVAEASGIVLNSWVPPSNLTGLAYDSSTGSLFAINNDSRVYQLDPDDGSILNAFNALDSGSRIVVRAGGLAAGDVTLPPDHSPPPPDLGNLAGVDGEPLRTIYRVRDAVIMGDSVAPVGVELSTNASLQAFIVALVHDPAVISLEDITTTGTETDTQNAEFTSVGIDSNGGTLAAIFDFDPPFHNNVLAPGDHQLIAHYHYRCVVDDLQVAEDTEIRFVDNVIGNPLKENVVVVEALSLKPETEPGTITCSPASGATNQPEFHCGTRHLPGTPEGRTGEAVEMCVHYAFSDFTSEGLSGMQMGVAYDCRLSCDSTVRVPPNSVTDVVGVDFLQLGCDNDPDDGDGCESVFSMLVDVSPPFEGDSFPPVSSPTVVACWDMAVSPEAQEGECLDFRFRDNVNGTGVIPTKNLVSIKFEDFPALTFPCEVCVNGSGPSLYCGAGSLEDSRPEVPVGQPGDVIDVCFWYRSPGEPVYAITQAVRYDCRLQCVPASFRVSPELDGILDPDSVTTLCDHFSRGLTDVNCELVLQFDQGSPGNPGVIPLPATGNDPVKLGCMAFRILDSTVRGRCLDVVHFDGIQGFKNEILLESGLASPDTFDCKVCVQPGLPAEFFCGGRTLGEDGFPGPTGLIGIGETTELCFWYKLPVDDFTDLDQIEGLSTAMEYDCQLTCDESSFNIPSESITAQVGVEFISFNCDNDPDDGDGCELVLAMLVDADVPIEGRTLPPSETPLLLSCVNMTVDEETPLGACLPLEFKDGVDGTAAIPVKNLVSAQSHAQTPITHDSEICTKPLGPKFFCGGEKLNSMGVPGMALGPPGETARTCFWYTNSTEHGSHHLQGFSMSMKFDCRLKCVDGSFHLPPDSILNSMNSDYAEFQCDNDPLDGDDCEIVFAVLLDTIPPFNNLALPPTETPLKLACFDFRLPEDSVCQDCFDITFMDGADGTSSLPTKNLVVSEFQSFIAQTCDCHVCVGNIQEKIPFIRGDCNDDELVNVVDAAQMISYLFLTGNWKANPPCLDACDANDDARVDLADVQMLLYWLFKGGPILPDPGPMMPGIDPTADKIECAIDLCPFTGD